MGESVSLFVRGLLRHFWLLVPGAFLGTLELVQRASGEAVELPAWLFWTVLGGGVLLAAFLAFHDLRQSIDPDASMEVRRAVGEEIGQIINEGEALANHSWPALAFSADEAWEFGVEWWNGAGVFVETVLGRAERQIISKPQRSQSQDGLIEAHCNLLRGTLERLPHLDLRIDDAGLSKAVRVRRETLPAAVLDM